MKCPVCERGEVHVNQCARCGVVVLSGSMDSGVVQRVKGRRFPARQDQSEMRPYADYLATKRDKE